MPNGCVVKFLFLQLQNQHTFNEDIKYPSQNTHKHIDTGI